MSKQNIFDKMKAFGNQIELEEEIQQLRLQEMHYGKSTEDVISEYLGNTEDISRLKAGLKAGYESSEKEVNETKLKDILNRMPLKQSYIFLLNLRSLKRASVIGTEAAMEECAEALQAVKKGVVLPDNITLEEVNNEITEILTENIYILIMNQKSNGKLLELCQKEDVSALLEQSRQKNLDLYAAAVMWKQLKDSTDITVTPEICAASVSVQMETSRIVSLIAKGLVTVKDGMRRIYRLFVNLFSVMDNLVAVLLDVMDVAAAFIAPFALVWVLFMDLALNPVSKILLIASLTLITEHAEELLEVHKESLGKNWADLKNATAEMFGKNAEESDGIVETDSEDEDLEEENAVLVE